MGFIVQGGFIETAQERFLKAYFEDLTKRLNYRYLGTVAKGESAGVCMFPKMFKKLFKLLNQLGTEFEKQHAFDPEIVTKMEKPYELSKRMLFLLKMVLLTNDWINHFCKVYSTEFDCFSDFSVILLKKRQS